MTEFSSLTDLFRVTERSPRLAIAPTLRPGTFNSHAVDCPFVFVHQGRVGVTFAGWDGVGYQTGLCWRTDDGGWTEPQLILPRDPDTSHRRYNAALTSILRDNDLFGSGELKPIDGWFYGTYHAYPDAGYEAGPGLVGVVRSRNLTDWEEYGDLIRPEEGADWEWGGLYKSWLLEHDSRYWIFYNAKDVGAGNWIEQTGAVVSDDLKTWRRVSDRPLLARGEPGQFDAMFASDPCVLRLGELWVMFYFGLDDQRPGTDSFDSGVGRDSFAISDDLVNWTKSHEVILDIGCPGSVDDKHAHKPVILYRDQVLEHYYCAVRYMEPLELAGYRQAEHRGIGVGRTPVPREVAAALSARYRRPDDASSESAATAR